MLFARQDDAPDSHANYMVRLNWTPAEKFKVEECNVPCEVAYATIRETRECGSLGGEEGFMAREASMQVGCGTLKYVIEPRPR